MNRFAKRFTQRKTAIIGLVALVFLIFIAIFAPKIVPYNPEEQDLVNRLKPPGFKDSDGNRFLLGTDHLGRDILSRCFFGARLSLSVGLSAVIIGGAFGLVVGLTSGYWGGWVDTVLMRIVDVQLSFPFMLLALTIISILGPSIFNVTLVLAITSWTAYAKIVRNSTLTVKSLVYIEAAEAIGAPRWRLIFLHILPNVISPFIIIATFQTSQLIITEASLSFLGLGVPTNIPTWGAMLSDGREYLTDAWWIAFFPGLLLSLTSLSINFVGDGLRDAMDPKELIGIRKR